MERTIEGNAVFGMLKEFLRLEVAAGFLLFGAAVLGLALANRLGVMRVSAYVIIGIALWVAVLNSGVHATLAGAPGKLFD